MPLVVAAASHDKTFVDTLTRVNNRCEAAYEPIRANSFRDYSTGLTTSDFQELARWLVDRRMSVKVLKLNNFLKVLKFRRNIIWNICHPKNYLVADGNSIFCVLVTFSIFTARTP